MVFSSSAIMAKERFGDPNYFSFKQIISGTFGLAIMFIVMKVDYHTYRHPVIVFSTLAIVVAMLVVVFFLAASAKTHRWIQFSGFSMQPSEMANLALIIFTAPVFYLLIFRVRYRRERILAFLNPWEEPLGRGFQMIQSLLSVASGGITGLGFMEGKQKLFYLPQPHTDFIFAVVGEELGLIGTC